MAERRSIGTALDFTPEQKAFAGLAASETTSTTKDTTRPQEEIPQESSGGETDSAQHERRIRRSPSRRQAPAPIAKSDQGLLLVANLLMPVTTRLQPETYAALKRAGLEQKLYDQNHRSNVP
jgi:hypothetical protein